MARKKKDEVEETKAEAAETASDEGSLKAGAVEAAPVEKTSKSAVADDTSVDDVPAAVEKPKKPAKTASKAAKPAKKADVTASTEVKSGGKRAEKVGIVSSDKMMKTVTVRVDRLVKHPVYRKYVKKRKKFMAHDDLGAKIGDKVKIVETRPLSARKRWRVVEIIHRAES